MRLSIFWRVILVQSALLALILGLSLYALTELNRLAHLSRDIVSFDSTCIQEEKRLLSVFLGQMRDAKKFVALGDQAFYTSFLQGDQEFIASTKVINSLIATEEERQLFERIKALHERFTRQLELSYYDKEAWEKRSAALGEQIIDATDQLIRLHEKLTMEKTVRARDSAASAATLMAWLTCGGLGAGVLLAYFHARGVNRPLRRLAKEMRQVGTGDFSRTIDIKAPQEIEQLAEDFNWMSAKLAELDQMKGDFIAHISHELRTPLTAMREGSAILLEEITGPLTDSQRKVLEVLSTNSDRLYRSICSILDLSKMEAGMMDYQVVPADLAALIRSSLASVELVARKKEIRLESAVNGDLPTVLIDEGRIQQVLDNLLNNALKFTPQGGRITVGTSLRKETDGSDSVQVSVSDTGEGIPTKDLERIFERFYQSPRKDGSSRQGTGLGLAICRYIVEYHKGDIWVESVVGTGSSFYFTLPVWIDNKGEVSQYHS